MKTNSVILCAVIVSVAQTFVSAQETEVSVQKGKVIAEIPTQSIAVEAGRKVVLAGNASPVVSVDNPLVHDALALYRLVEEEKAHGDLKIDMTGIFVVDVQEEQRAVAAVYLETPNRSSSPTDIYELSQTVRLNWQVYDLDGNLLQADMEPISDVLGKLRVHFRKPVGPGELFQVIAVIDQRGFPVLPGNLRAIWKEGPLWHFAVLNNVYNGLNYFRYILPESAVFVGSNEQVLCTDMVAGRVAVTMRNYTGPTADGICAVAFLWPDEDGTTLADIPDRYHWLQTLLVDEVDIGDRSSEGAHDLQGQNMADFIYQNKRGRHAGQGWFSYEMKVRPYEPMILVCTYWGGEGTKRVFDILVDGERLATQELLQNKPGEFFDVRYAIPSELTEGKESVAVRFQARPASIAGGVYGCEIMKGPRELAKPAPVSDLRAATYKGLNPGDSMTRWAFLGPMPIHGVAYPPEQENQMRAFDEDPFDLERFEPKVTIGDEDYEWVALRSPSPIINPPRPPDRLYYVYGYAWAQIDMPEQTNAILGIGSDDAVKVWLNGRLVHRHWTNRTVVPDHDLVPVTFREGRNQLVLKLQNADQSWGFSCRMFKASPELSLSAATYEGLKPGEFMKKWLVLGPIPVTQFGPDPTDEGTQKRAFDDDPLNVAQLAPRAALAGVEYEWRAVRSGGDIVDLFESFGPKPYVGAYAWAQVEMAEETSAVLGIGSDDAVKVWLNGKLVHENWAKRGVEPDSDRVPVTFKKGKNQLVLKVQNGILWWQFACRLLEN